MSVIIMGAEPSRRIGFVECNDIVIFIEMKSCMDFRDSESTGKTAVHHRKVVGALRVSSAVTRLTVDRRHQVRRAPTFSLNKLSS